MKPNAPGKGKLAASLSRVPKEEVTQPPTPAVKKGLEVVREKFQRTADHEPEARVVVWDYDKNRALFSGTPSEYSTLVKAIDADLED